MIKLQNSYQNKLINMTFLDLFSGIGSFHLALRSFGANCIGAAEVKPSAIKVYTKNFVVPYIENIMDIQDDAYVDIITAGFPCQPFSISGKKKGLDDERGMLFYEAVRIIRTKQPRVIILENVANIEKHNSGDTFSLIVNSLKQAGYNIFTKVLNSSDYGVAQSRKRMFIVGFREDLMVNEFGYPEKIQNTRSLLDYLEVSSEKSLVISNNYKCVFDSENVNKLNKTMRIGRINKGRQGERIYSVNGHSITLSASGGGVGGKTGLYQVDGVVRRLSVRECARVMGFPDDFNIDNLSHNTGYELFGNAVVIDVIQHLVISIINKLEEIGEI